MSVRMVLVGPPGAGKGTQAEAVTRKFGVPAVSTGAIFRAHTEAGDELGRLADSFTSRGELVPDEVTDRMVEARLDQPDAAGGFLLDGYPRNLHQVASLDAMLARCKDDTEKVIRHRIALYHETTEPLIAEYRSRGVLVSVDGIGGIDEVASRVCDALDAYLESR